MTTQRTQPDGVFTAESRPGLTGQLASMAAIVAAVALVVRYGVASGGPDQSWLGAVGILFGALGVVAGLAGLLRAASRAEAPWQKIGGIVAASAIASLASFVYGSHLAGKIRLDRFADQWLNREILGAVAGDLVSGAMNTVKFALAAELFAVVLGLIIATMLLSERRWLRLPGVVYVDLFRSLPLVVLTLLVSGGLVPLGITLDLFAGATTVLTINASAYIAEIFRAGIRSLAQGQMDAARSLGMPRSTAMYYVIIPQAVRVVLPPLLNEFIALIKDTAIVVVLFGVTISQRDLFTAATSAVASTFNTTPLIGAAIGYLLMVIPLTRLLSLLEKRQRASAL